MPRRPRPAEWRSCAFLQVGEGPQDRSNVDAPVKQVAPFVSCESGKSRPPTPTTFRGPRPVVAAERLSGFAALHNKHLKALVFLRDRNRWHGARLGSSR